jgi:uncharacterized RDD family membrane protein YckC
MEDKSQFAGFWKRAGAYTIDSLIICFGEAIMFGIGFVIVNFVLKMDHHALGGFGLLVSAIAITMQILYHSLFESSSKQATPGKMALGIVVTNAQGGRIGFGRAVGRNAGRFISGLFCGLGYIICGFTDRRQAVHDFLASTLVVKNDAPLRLGPQDSLQIMQSP